jgi:peptidyl-prolyl cis-trans isomerase D
MVSLLRRFQQPLMIFVTVIIIISFTWFYSRNDFLDKGGSGQVATIYGRPVTFAQTQRVGRRFDLCQDLGLMELLRSLAIRQQDAKENFIWNSLVLRHESEKLAIEPTADEVVAAIQAMPVFQTNGAYDSSKYNMISQIALAPRGFSTDDMEDLIRDDLRLKKIKDLLGATVAPSESELRDAFAQASQKTDASVIRLKLDDFAAAVQVSDEDVKKLYEERKAALKSDETRKVKYVAFILPTTDTPLDPKARAEALGKLAKQAEDFSVAMTDKDAKLEDVAAKFGAKVEETADFSRGTPPPELGSSPDAAMSAFKLTKDQPNGDVLSTDRGYYVIQLASITPPRPLTFEEAKDKLVAGLKDERAMEALNLKATEIRNKIDADLKAGKSFAEAASAAGVKADKFPAFSRMEPQMEPENSGEIMTVAGELNEGQLSTATPTANGSVIVFVEKRLPLDEEKYKSEKVRVTENMTGFQKAVLFGEWLKLRRAAADLKVSYKS